MANRQVVLSPFYPISDKLDTSHRAGWARYWANELKAEIFTTGSMGQIATLKKGDEILMYHGMEFKGQLNLQSGLTDEILGRVKLVLDAKKRGVVFGSLDVPGPRYGRLLADRGMDPDSAEALDKVGTNTPFLGAPNKGKLVVIGDSHALSLYRPGSTISRSDGLTLHGALKTGLSQHMQNFVFEADAGLAKADVLTFYFGNIDIRHHLGRQPDPKASIKELVDEYGQQLAMVVKDFRPKVLEVVMPLPIEDESRPIPKSGWYKGAPFFGPWSVRHQMRLELRDRLRRMCKKYGFASYEHPRHFVGRDGKLPFEVMEKPRSVHVRPAEYRLVQEGQAWNG